jgi:ABC-type nitrate/sulfonate/bicarbonate transport system ATPase subunit
MTSSVKLRVCGVTKRYGANTVIEDVSLELRDGETVAIIGASGVGKTTLFNVVAGLIAPDAGTVYINDRDITGVAGQVGYMLQKDLLLPYKSVVDNVALPLIIAGEKKGDARKKAAAMFDKFGLKGYEKTYPDGLSGGMRQRAALLRTFFISRDVTLLDEPFSALDALTKTAVQRWYVDMVKELGLSTLLITHDIDEAVSLSDRVMILKGAPGRLVAEIDIVSRDGTPDFMLSGVFLDYKREIMNILSA